MILSIDQIKSIILNRPNKELVLTAQKYSKVLRMHFYGESLEEVIKTIDGFESDKMKDLRLLYAKSNKDLFSRLARPVDKVFSARGGSIYYNLSEQLENKARSIALNVRDGYSVRKWNESFWKPHFMDDPNGMIFIEIDNNGVAYPTFKLVSSVYDYQVKGNNLEYVVFAVDKADKQKLGIEVSDTIYRVIDDAFDYYIKVDGETVAVLPQHTYPNYFMKVPAILNSDIPHPSMPGLKLSIFNDVIELANEFLVEGSIRKTHKYRHGFPKYWEYADSCMKCSGTGLFSGESCKECKGTGKSIMTRVSDVKLMTYPDKDDAVVTPTVAGYIEPSEAYHKMSTQELENLEETAYATMWGITSKKKTTGGESKTATEIIDDYQPIINRLSMITDSAEAHHKFILDMVISHNITQAYKGASVNYGRRYMLEGPDVIWKKYIDAKSSGAPVSMLDDLLTEFIESKYDNDPVGMAITLKLKDVEPFIHLSIKDLKDAGVSTEEVYKKLYYNEWLSNITDFDLLNQTIKDLRDDLENFVKTEIKINDGQAA